MGEAYSDKRWKEPIVGITSECCKCKKWHGFGKCDQYPEGIPKEKLDQSFPGTRNYNKKYCEHKSK